MIRLLAWHTKLEKLKALTKELKEEVSLQCGISIDSEIGVCQRMRQKK